MMAAHPSPGYQADWLNGWMAALGVTVLVTDARLAWTDDPVPHAWFDHPADEFPAVLFAALPTLEDLAESPLARNRPGLPELKRNLDFDVYQQRAAYERATGAVALGCTVTDLAEPDATTGLPHSPFDPSAPRGITLWQRALTCREAIDGPDAVARSLAGLGDRVTANGLGFDIRRLSPRAENTDNLVDPVVELLAFAALELFPTRGDGRRATTRGWTGPGMRAGAFTWGTWDELLDRWGIDAWLDRLYTGEHLPAPPVRFEVVPYQPTGSSDVTRGLASRRLP